VDLAVKHAALADCLTRAAPAATASPPGPRPPGAGARPRAHAQQPPGPGCHGGLAAGAQGALRCLAAGAAALARLGCAPRAAARALAESLVAVHAGVRAAGAAAGPSPDPGLQPDLVGGLAAAGDGAALTGLEDALAAAGALSSEAGSAPGGPPVCPWQGAGAGGARLLGLLLEEAAAAAAAAAATGELQAAAAAAAARGALARLLDAPRAVYPEPGAGGREGARAARRRARALVLRAQCARVLGAAWGGAGAGPGAGGPPGGDAGAHAAVEDLTKAAALLDGAASTPLTPRSPTQDAGEHMACAAARAQLALELAASVRSAALRAPVGRSHSPGAPAGTGSGRSGTPAAPADASPERGAPAGGASPRVAPGAPAPESPAGRGEAAGAVGAPAWRAVIEQADAAVAHWEAALAEQAMERAGSHSGKEPAVGSIPAHGGAAQGRADAAWHGEDAALDMGAAAGAAGELAALLGLQGRPAAAARAAAAALGLARARAPGCAAAASPPPPPAAPADALLDALCPAPWDAGALPGSLSGGGGEAAAAAAAASAAAARVYGGQGAAAVLRRVALHRAAAEAAKRAGAACGFTPQQVIHLLPLEPVICRTLGACRAG